MCRDLVAEQNARYIISGAQQQTVIIARGCCNLGSLSTSEHLGDVSLTVLISTTGRLPHQGPSHTLQSRPVQLRQHHQGQQTPPPDTMPSKKWGGCPYWRQPLDATPNQVRTHRHINTIKHKNNHTHTHTHPYMHSSSHAGAPIAVPVHSLSCFGVNQIRLRLHSLGADPTGCH